MSINDLLLHLSEADRFYGTGAAHLLHSALTDVPREGPLAHAPEPAAEGESWVMLTMVLLLLRRPGDQR